MDFHDPVELRSDLGPVLSVSNADAVSQLYSSILKRSVDDGGLNAWVAALNGGVTLAEVRAALINSAEASATIDPLVRLYEAAFGRVPEDAGLEGWATALRSGTSFLEIAEGFTGSAEFAARYPEVANGDLSGFITALYQQTLGRAPEAAGLAGWIGSGLSTAEILIGFSESLEFHNRSEANVTTYLSAVGQGNTPNAVYSLFQLGTSAELTGDVIDGKVAGATIGIDVNGDGIISDDEPTLTTDALGNFSFPDGTPMGNLIATGGTDISTGLAFTGKLEAPSGSTVITPLTTVIKKLTDLDTDATKTDEQKAADAQTQLKALLGLTSIGADITQVDFVTEASEGDVSGTDGLSDLEATQLYAASVQLLNIVAQGSAAITGADGSVGGEAASDAVFAALANALNNQPAGTQVDLTSSTATDNDDTNDANDLLTNVIKDAAGNALTGDALANAQAIADSAAKIVAAANKEVGDVLGVLEALDPLDPNFGDNSINTLVRIVQTQKVVQGEAADELRTAAGSADPDAAADGLADTISSEDGSGFNDDSIITSQNVGDITGDGTDDDGTDGTDNADGGGVINPDGGPQTPINTAPTVALSNVTISIDENTSTAVRIRVADIDVTDDALGTNTLALTGNDAGLFEIDGTALYLSAGVSLDFETDPSFDVSVTVDDSTVGNSPDNQADLTVAINDVNEAPTVALSNATTSIDENTDTTDRIRIADIGVTDDALGTNTLALTGDDAGLFEIVGTELYLKAGASLDFETDPSFDVSVTVDDTTVGNSPDSQADLTVAINDVNEAPTAVTLTNATTSIDENTDTTDRIRIADIDVTDDALGTNTLALTGDDAGLFEIDGTELYLRAWASLDFETDPSFDVSITVDDTTVGNSPDSQADLTLAINDVNEAPTGVTLTNATTSIDENTDTTDRIRIADIGVTDDALGINTLALTGDDAGLFEIDGNALFLKAGTVLDAETASSLDVQVTADDETLGAANSIEATSDLFTLTINDVNEAPTAVTLTNATTSIDENTDTTDRIRIADIGVTDDALGINTLALTGDDAGLFEIVGNALFLKAGTVLDAETASSLDVQVTADDETLGAANSIEATSDLFTLTINDVNEAPTGLADDVATTPVTVSEFLVNEETNNNQQYPSVTALSDGRFVVTWESYDLVDDKSSAGIKAKIFNADGTSTADSEFLVNEETNSFQQVPSVTALSDGKFVVTWHSLDGVDDKSGTGIKAKIFNADGTSTADSEFLVNEETNSTQERPSVTALSDGKFVVTWHSFDGVDDPSNTGIKAKIFNADGTSTADSEFLVNEETNGHQLYPSVTALSDGKFIVTWYSQDGVDDQSGWGIKAKIFNADGTSTADSEFLVNEETSRTQAHPSVTALSDGKFVVTWHSADGVDDKSGTGIKAKIFNADGTSTADSEFLVNEETNGHQLYPSVTALSDGKFIVTWYSLDGVDDQSGYGIKAKIFNADGTSTADSEFLVNEETNSTQERPSVTALSDGKFVVTWHSLDGVDDKSGTGIKAKIFNADGSEFKIEADINEDAVALIDIASLLANDTDPEGGILTFVSADVTSASGAVITVNGDGTLTYDPTNADNLQDLNTGENLIDTFTYDLTDGENQVSATVSVTVQGIDDNIVQDL